MGTPDTSGPSAPSAPVSPPEPPVARVRGSFWSLRLPDERGRRRILITIMIVMVVICFDVAPIWRLFWRWHIYSFFNCSTVKDAHGQKREAWRWVEGRSIRVYALPGIRANHAETVASGVRDLLRDAGLDFTVEVRPIPPAVLEAYNASTITRDALTFVSFRGLGSRLIELRDGDPHADVLVIDSRIEEAHWAYGMANFTSGLILARSDMSTPHLGKHEAGHLMGYMRHDSQPIFVFGYPCEGWPWKRSTLMMLLGDNPNLSPRARDALRCFWEGMERETGEKYLLPEGEGR